MNAVVLAGTEAMRKWPGTLVCVVIALASTFVSEHYGGPQLIYALLIGLAFHFLSGNPQIKVGVDFCGRTLLRVGVALLGARITVEQVAHLGWRTAAVIVLAVSLTVGCGVLLARLLKRPPAEGVLSGGAVAICGASAALAISSVLPKGGGADRDTLFTVVAVTSLSTIAMIAYPVLYGALGFDDVESGILLGATIHDVAQVVGAGYAISPEAGDVATYVKLLRVALLPVVVIAVALAMRSRAGAARSAGPIIPGFAVAFLVILVVNSAGLVPQMVTVLVQDASRWLLVAAIAALGMKTSLKAMFELGPGHVLVVGLETLFLLGLAVGLAWAFAG
jgi:uncharacterized integral membrane protein (TIGR00698 family)